MINISTWNSIGHPDRMADYICAYLVDRIIEKNPNARCDLAASVRHDNIEVWGSLLNAPDVDIESLVRQAVKNIGYTKGYFLDFFGLSGDTDFTVSCSMDNISLLEKTGQKPFPFLAWGMATNTPETDYLPWDNFTAQKMGNWLVTNRSCGLDVTVEVQDCEHKKIIAYVPTTCEDDDENILEYAKVILPEGCGFELVSRDPLCQGAYHRFGMSGQCKQNLYGSTLPVSYNGWGKYGTDNELLFVLIARFAALEFIKKNPEFSEIRSYVALSDDAEEINVILFDEKMQQISHCCKPADLPRIVSLFGLNKSRFCEMCKLGVFASF